ncbi:hypothetical protein WKI68_27305 [Streptomyces sp. MS1.HAVA.3]|uniref:Uncharacterized protein n=1 Tax=Streptomyces caledonius TaxID=3134107 RepID=A0ABU8U852_9ACTN
MATQPWGVDRPYGVLLFWGLLLLVIPAAVFRIGMAVVDRVRPRAAPAAGRHRGARPSEAVSAVTARLPGCPPCGEPRPPAPTSRRSPSDHHGGPAVVHPGQRAGDSTTDVRTV